MKKSRYTAEQVVFALRQAESGTPVPEVCRKMEVSERRACNVIQLLRSTYRYRGVADEQAALRVGSVGKITWFRQRIEELISYNACLTAHSMDAVLIRTWIRIPLGAFEFLDRFIAGYADGKTENQSTKK
jgi:putative transposase